MNRRDSLLNGGDEIASKPNSEQCIVQEYTTPVASEDYDATAAALSRLSVLADNGRADGSASPALNEDSTYEMAIPTSCPSPSKRGSDYFDLPLDESNLKRLRREARRKPSFIQVTHDFLPGMSANSPTDDKMESVILGLGIHHSRDLQHIPPQVNTSHSSLSIQSLYNHNTRTSGPNQRVGTSDLKTRKRSTSLPTHASPRWFEFVRKPKTISPTPCGKSRCSREPSCRRIRDQTQITSPPITQHTLRELELGEIFKNAQLRHDIVHDPNLQFRPNTDGERGAKKRHESKRYWRSIAKELEEIPTMTRTSLQKTRLSVMFQEMKKILLSLVPTSEKLAVETSFDHEYFLQTLNHNLFSTSSFAEYMSSLMKRHCAPMRDEVIDRTIRKLEGASSSLHFTEALRDTFDVLEVMKLDVANHQLRTFRGYLLDSAVEFERNWFQRKYNSGTYSEQNIKAWYLGFTAHSQKGEVHDHRTTFVSAFVSLVDTTSSRCDIPVTFHFDQQRIITLNKDLNELVSLSIILMLARQLDKNGKDKVKKQLKAEIWALLSNEAEPGLGDKWLRSVPNIAMHLLTYANSTTDSVSVTLPHSDQVKFVESWLRTNLDHDSTIYKMLHARLLVVLRGLVLNELNSVRINGQIVTPAVDWGVMGVCQTELENLATRISSIANYHWKVHGSEYVLWSQL